MNNQLLLVLLLVSLNAVMFVSFSTTLSVRWSSDSSHMAEDMPPLEDETPNAQSSSSNMTPSSLSSKGRLRRNWSENPPLSDFANLILQQQSDCSLPVTTLHLDDPYGFGSHISLWSQSVCNAMEDQRRLRTHNPQWLWMDQTQCDAEEARQSPLLCYFPGSEFLCGKDERITNSLNVTDPRSTRQWCKLLRQSNPRKIRYEPVLDEFRAASTEYLFRKVSPLVIREAERQASFVFAENGGIAPDDLITVHMRWGDKFWEMELAHEFEYIQAISDLLHQHKQSNQTANIYLATEDPRARDAFLNVAPPGWKVYLDRTIEELDEFRPTRGNRASHTARNTQGRAGLVAIGSLLLAMEAKYYVLTTRSNWSRVMNHLRAKILDPRCGNCTSMIDLRPGLW